MADPVADRRPDLLAARGGHELGGRARGDAAWFEHEDAATFEPGLVEQGRRYLGGLAGPGRRLEHEPRVRREQRAQFGQDLVDREAGWGQGVRLLQGTRHSRRSSPCASPVWMLRRWAVWIGEYAMGGVGLDDGRCLACTVSKNIEPEGSSYKRCAWMVRGLRWLASRCGFVVGDALSHRRRSGFSRDAFCRSVAKCIARERAPTRATGARMGLRASVVVDALMLRC